MQDEIPCFDSEKEAWAWLLEEVDDGCVDNERFVYFHASPLALEEYEKAKESGCCGSIDRTVKINGRLAYIGCNFGH